MLANCHTFWMVATFGSADMLTNFFLHAQRSLRAIRREDGSPSFWISLKTGQSQSVWPKMLERRGTAQVPVPNFILAFLREYGQNWRDEGILWHRSCNGLYNPKCIGLHMRWLLKLVDGSLHWNCTKRFSYYFPHLWSSVPFLKNDHQDWKRHASSLAAQQAHFCTANFQQRYAPLKNKYRMFFCVPHLLSFVVSLLQIKAPQMLWLSRIIELQDWLNQNRELRAMV